MTAETIELIRYGIDAGFWLVLFWLVLSFLIKGFVAFIGLIIADQN